MGPGATVLVVDDDADIRHALRLLLEDAGARVISAANGLEALALLAIESPDVILCDLRMPVLDGFGFVRRLRQNPRRAHTSVIAISAISSFGQERAQAAGFDGYLAKPFNVAHLVGILAGARARRAA
jgi:CheY-like chemotaxis protein